MSGSPDPGEIARLQRENAALNEQVKLLVRLEQRLFRAQNQLSLNNDRLRLVTEFSLSATGEGRVTAILSLLNDLLHETFSLDEAHLIVDEFSDGQWDLTHNAELSHCTRVATSDLWERVKAVEGASFVEASQAELARLVHTNVSNEGYHALLPVRLQGVTMAVFSMLGAPRVSLSIEAECAFARVIVSHAERAIENTVLTSRLRDRTRELADTNQRLSDSLKHLQQTQEQLAHASKMEAIGLLAGGIAHDFNNLMSVMLTNATFVREGLGRNSKFAPDLDDAITAGQRAAQITRQLLTMSRKHVPKQERFELFATIELLTRVLRRTIGENIDLHLAPCTTPYVVSADRTQIEQVILNLVVNARDAMPNGGTIQIGLRHAAAADLHRAGINDPAARFVVVQVSDTGVGMDRTTAARIFEPFFSTKAQGHGTGLGLAVAYGAVQQASGHIFVDTEVAKGSTFTILLPRVDEGAVTDAITTNKAPAKTILVVDDEDGIRRVVNRVLTGAGYTVVEAPDGLAALDVAARTDAIDLLVSDLGMPRMGGVDLARQLMRARPGLSVLFMTGHSAETGEASAIAPCMAKPFTHVDLLDAVNERFAAHATHVLRKD
ncbi:MAG: response regulator [Deltaproteobacteria bacterium]|nr:response regulator [Deltaproteobacteria bacterium]